MGYLLVLAILAILYAILHNSKVKHTFKPINPLKRFLDTKASYLKSSTWKTKRLQVLKRDNYTCQSCEATGVILHVHHMRDYKLIPNEPISSLVTLCASCHTQQHQFYGYPQTLADYYNWNAPLTRN